MPFLHERLPNGLDVVAETSDAAVSTSVGFFVTTGARDESPGIEGVSHFLEHMVFKGPPGLSAEEINCRFDRLGAAANAFTGEEDTVYHASVLPRHQHAVVDLLAHMMRPELRDDDFATEKKVILEEIQMYDDQPPFGADDRCKASFFGTHPLAASVLGTAASIESLEPAAMRDYHRRRYTPNAIVLAASGAVDFPALVDSARRLCGEWEPVPQPPRLADGRPRAAAMPGHERITRSGAALEYAVRMTAGPDEEDPDRWAAALPEPARTRPECSSTPGSPNMPRSATKTVSTPDCLSRNSPVRPRRPMSCSNGSLPSTAGPARPESAARSLSRLATRRPAGSCWRGNGRGGGCSTWASSGLTPAVTAPLPTPWPWWRA